jgi:hypothetical protein
MFRDKRLSGSKVEIKETKGAKCKQNDDTSPLFLKEGTRTKSYPDLDIGINIASAVCMESNFGRPAYCPPLY